MPGSRRLLLGVWGGAVLIALGAVRAWVGAVPRTARERWDPPSLVSSRDDPDSARLRLAAAHLRSADPFRLERRAATQRFDPWAPTGSVAPAAPPPPPRPALALGGIVGGPPWSAVIEGIPGREAGVLMSVGDSVSGIRLVRIAADTARLVGYDTSWTLTPRQAWR